MTLKWSTVVVVFAVLSIIMGELFSFYNTYWWWDLMLHTMCGALLTFFFRDIYKHNNIDISDKNLMFIVVGLSVNTLVIWEILEYWADTHLNLNMQKDGIKDTMEDLIVGKVGCMFYVVWYYVMPTVKLYRRKL